MFVDCCSVTCGQVVKELCVDWLVGWLQSGIMIEAKLMAGLKHRNIVRMIGVCKNAGESIMLVLELASLGPLHKYLHSHTYVHCPSTAPCTYIFVIIIIIQFICIALESIVLLSGTLHKCTNTS